MRFLTLLLIAAALSASVQEDFSASAPTSDGSANRRTMVTAGTTPPPPTWAGRSARGTATAPSALLADDPLLRLEGYGYGTTGYSATARAYGLAAAAENWSDSAQGSYWDFWTTPNGSTTPARVMRLFPSGRIGMGTTTDNGTDELQVQGTISSSNKAGTFDGLAPSTTKGDLIVRNSSTNTRVPVGADGAVLVADSGQAAGVNWSTASAFPLSTAGFYWLEEWIPNSNAGEKAWGNAVSGTGAQITLSSAKVDGNHFGIIAPETGTTTTGYACSRFGYMSIVLGGSTFKWEGVVQNPVLSNGTDTYVAMIGLGNDTAGAEHTNGVYFKYDSTASANWEIVTAAGGTRTTTATSVPVPSAAWSRLSFTVNAAASSVVFSIDGTVVGTTTTNIPIGQAQAIAPNIKIVKSAGTSTRQFLNDYFLMNATYTSTK